MATIWLAVFAFPHLLAGMITFSAAATMRRPDTANSLAIITIATHADTLPRSTKATSAAEIRSLSAKGSRNVPSTVVWLLPVSYTHLRAHETDSYLVCRLLLEKKKKKKTIK